MVAVVQLVEHQVVILGVAGSSPVSHPKHADPGSFVAKVPGFRHMSPLRLVRCGLYDKMCVFHRRVIGRTSPFALP